MEALVGTRGWEAEFWGVWDLGVAAATLVAVAAAMAMMGVAARKADHKK